MASYGYAAYGYATYGFDVIPIGINELGEILRFHDDYPNVVVVRTYNEDRPQVFRTALDDDSIRLLRELPQEFLAVVRHHEPVELRAEREPTDHDIWLERTVPLGDIVMVHREQEEATVQVAVSVPAETVRARRDMVEPDEIVVTKTVPREGLVIVRRDEDEYLSIYEVEI